MKKFQEGDRIIVAGEPERHGTFIRESLSEHSNTSLAHVHIDGHVARTYVMLSDVRKET